MENLISKAEQRIIGATANLMKHLARVYNFSHVDQAWKPVGEDRVWALGANLVGMMVLELKQCRNFPVEHIQATVGQLRRAYSRYFVSQDFRQAAKLYGRLWAIEVAKRFGYESLERKSVLFNEIEYLLNELMSPIGVEGGTPMFADPDIDEDTLLNVYRRLPHFVGMSDYLDIKTDTSISRLLSGTLVSPRWYDQDSYGDGFDGDMAMSLYTRIADQVEPLKRPYTIELNDGLVNRITVSEYTGLSIADLPFRCLVAVTTHHGAEGNDFYIALLSDSFSDSGLLVGSTVDFVGEEVVYKVYQAYTKAIEEETGNLMDMDAMVSELEDEEVFW